MIWPADAPWGGDDVTLITTAISANQHHRLITAGLGGSFGYPYGPIPSQIYQLLAMFSHDPIVLVRLHAGLFAAVTAFALLYLANVLGVSAWLAPVTMLGPFFWFYTRLMWDNTFAIPCGSLLLASYGGYLRRQSRAAFFTTVACGIALPLIHPMTLPLALAVGGHAAYAHWRAVKKHWLGLIVIAVCVAILCGPYFKRIAEQIGHSPGLIAPRADALSRAGALAFPLLSGRLFCAYGFFDGRGPEIGWEQNRVVMIARYISLLAYPLIWLGAAMAARAVFISVFVPDPSPLHNSESSLDQTTRSVTLPMICLAALFLQSLMDAWLRISPYPHYYTGTWAAIVVLLWIGLASLSKLKVSGTVVAVYAAVMAISTIAFAVDIHTHSGGSVWYGPSIGAQLKK